MIVELSVASSSSSASLSGSTTAPFSAFWLGAWSLALALGWLLPNHYAPWLAFHFDAWIAGGLATAAAVVILRSKQPIAVHRFALWCTAAATIPLFQFWFGLLPFAGQAWIGAAFVVGLAVSVMLGGYWESVSPGQPMDGLFAAIGTAAIVSMGLALYQWLGLDIAALDLWVMAMPDIRPYANFVQPNQLATFLLWGLLAGAWGFQRGYIRAPVALLMALFVLFGVAMTQSRTAFLAVIGMAMATYAWRRLWPRKVVWAAAGLAAYFVLCVAALPALSSALNLNETLGMVARTETSIRRAGLMLFVDAAMRAPLFGYGWSQTAVAQLAVAADHGKLGGIFMHAHNLFLDLVIWCGVPLGGLLSAAIIYWFIGKTRAVTDARDAILVTFVGVVGWHAMLELPLHYAYMLLPTGVVVGVLNSRLSEPVITYWPRWKFAAVWVLATSLLVVITRDYLRIEENFYVLRFERARIGSKPTEPPRSVLILDHMNEFLRLGRTPAKRNMTPDELVWMHKAAYAYPGLANLFNLATAFAWNGKTWEAQTLVNSLRGVTSVVQYAQLRGVWQKAAREDAALAAVSWPE